MLNFDSNYTQTTTGGLLIDLEGTGAGFFDLITVGGDATLDGDLVVAVTGGFDPAVGDSFEIIDATAGAVVGTFESLFFPVLDPGEFMIIDYQPDTVTLLIVDEGFEADFDKDGDVDEDDLIEWQEGFGMQAGATMSDGGTCSWV